MFTLTAKGLHFFQIAMLIFLTLIEYLVMSLLSLPRPSLYNENRPFPSCCLSRFQSKSWCSTIVREMSLICIRIRNSFPFEWLCTRTRFETEACSNSEMGYYYRKLGHDGTSEPDLTFSLPKLKGFQIAFVNIVSLPKYLD